MRAHSRATGRRCDSLANRQCVRAHNGDKLPDGGPPRCSAKPVASIPVRGALTLKVALCAIPFFAIAVSSAQQQDQAPQGTPYVIAEAQTITVQELQQRSQSKALGAFHKAKLLAQQGDHAGAMKAFEKALKTDPLFSDARNDFAVELLASGQEDRAVDQLQQLVQLDPGFLLGYTNLGVILCHQNRYAGAEATLRRALGVNPRSAKANFLFALALKGQGKGGTEEAHNALQSSAQSLPCASRLLKEWFGTSDVADARSPQN